MKKPDRKVSYARLKGRIIETGEEIAVEAPRFRPSTKGWRDKVGLVDLGVMKRLELSGLEYRVLFAVMEAVPVKGGVVAFITVEEIATAINSTVPSVSRTLKSLRERNIVTRQGGKVGRLAVNPWLMYNGDFASWGAETDGVEEPIWVRGVDLGSGEVR